MSEFMSNPEAIKSFVQKLEQDLADLDIAYANAENESEEDMLREEARIKKHQLLELLLELKEFESIKTRIEGNIIDALEMFGDEMPIFIEQALDDSFAIEAETELQEEITQIANELIEKYQLVSFSDDEEE